MKGFIFVFSLLLSLMTVADQSEYIVEKGKLHSGGSATLIDLDHEDDQFFIIKINYEIIKKKLAPIPESQLKGDSEIIFPKEFKSEDGYKNLETQKVIEIRGSRIEFLRRVDLGTLKNAYEIVVYPRNKRSKVTFIYHPNLNHLGWKEVSIVLINKLPVLNGYEIKLTQK